MIVLIIKRAGWFTWDGKDFSHSATEINLRDGHHLEAMLPKKDGHPRERQGINLNDRISNVNGKLTYGKHFSHLSLPRRLLFS